MPDSLVKRHAFADGREFVVVVDDLLAQPVDTIVSAANGGLSGGEGVAGQIARGAGAALEKECFELIKKRGRLPVGEVVATTAGKLPFKGVLHAVSPRQGDGDEEEKIYKVLLAAFRRADDRRWTSLAFPGIGMGTEPIPHAICARAYVRAVRDFFTARPRSMKSIRLCLLKGALLDAVVREMGVAFAPPSGRPPASAAVGRSRAPGRPGGRGPGGRDAGGKARPGAGKPGAPAKVPAPAATAPAAPGGKPPPGGRIAPGSKGVLVRRGPPAPGTGPQKGPGGTPPAKP